MQQLPRSGFVMLRVRVGRLVMWKESHFEAADAEPRGAAALRSRHTVDVASDNTNAGHRPSPPAKPPFGKHNNAPWSSYSSLGMSQQAGVT